MEEAGDVGNLLDTGLMDGQQADRAAEEAAATASARAHPPAPGEASPDFDRTWSADSGWMV